MENNKVKSALEKALEEAINGEVVVDENAFPVDFDEGVDFMGTGIVVHNFGEIIGCCSEKLCELSAQNIYVKLSIWDAVRRFLTGDFGDVTPESTKKAEVNYREGLPAWCRYQNYYVGEGEIILAVDQLGHPENPRSIYALLPSEQAIIDQWYDEHEEEQPQAATPYAMFIHLH